MLGKGLHKAAIAAVVPPLGFHTWRVVALLVALLLLVFLGWLVVLGARRRKATARDSSAHLNERSLVIVWQRFLAGLPSAARPLVSRYPWVVVLGESGSGKTTLINAKADWQTQSNNRFPSHTDDSLLQLYLGRCAVVHEVSPQVLADPGKTATESLHALWRPLARLRPPLAVIVLSLEQLLRTPPEQLRHQAQRLAGKLAQLRELSGAPILTRVCLTHLDAFTREAPSRDSEPSGNKSPSSGMEQLAELLHGLRVPLWLSLDGLALGRPQSENDGEPSLLNLGEPAELRMTPGPIAVRFLKYAAYLKYALSKLPTGGFDSMVQCMAGAPQSLRALETLLFELTRASKSASADAAPNVQLDQLYFMPFKPDLQRANPLQLAGVRPPRLTQGLHKSGLLGLWTALRTSRVLSTWHAKLCAVLVLLAMLIEGAVYFSHGEAVQHLETACKTLDEGVNKSVCSAGSPAESVKVRRAAFQAGDLLQSIATSERFWPLLAGAFEGRKSLARRTFLSSIRRAYFVPQLAVERRRIAFMGAHELRAPRIEPDPKRTSDPKSEEDIRPEVDIEAEESMARIIYALAALHASRDSVLGDLLKKSAPRVAAGLSVSERTLIDYVNNMNTEQGRCGSRLQENRPPPVPGEADGPLLFTKEEPWLNFITEVQKVTETKSGHTALTRTSLLALQKTANRLEVALQLIERIHWLREIADALDEECDVDVKSHVGPLGWALVPPEWLAQNLKAFSAVIRIVLGSELDLPPNKELSMAELQELLSALAAKKSKSSEPDQMHTMMLRDFKNKEKDLQFSEQHWHDALDAARRDLLLARLRGSSLSKERGVAHFTKGGDGHKKAKGSNSSAKPLRRSLRPKHGSSGFQSSPDGTPRSSSGLPDPYNKVAFERDVKPFLIGADKALATAGLPPADRARVLTGVLEHARSYARRYRETLQTHFTSFGIRADSPAALRSAVGEMLLPESAFLGHLRLITSNADLGDLQGPYLQPLVESLAEFRPLIKLTTTKDGSYPDLEPYRAVLAQLAGALDSAANPEATADTALRDSLSGLGRLALSMLAEEESSPLLATQRYLDKAGIAPEIRGPFLAPLRRALRLGTAEAERVIASRWHAVREAQVRPLYSRFPFDRAAVQDVPLSALDIIHPKDGPFWRFIREDLAGLVTVQPDGRVAAKRQPGGPLALPADLISTASQLGRLSHKLWDGKDGARRPLEIRVRPQPLSGTAGPYAITRAYLSVGGSAVVGYNQMPSDRLLQVVWWNQENASVGIDLSTPDSPARQHASVDETRSAWSLLRLLLRGKLSSENVASFIIPVELKDAHGSVEVRFGFAEDPFALFQVPSATADGR